MPLAFKTSKSYVAVLNIFGYMTCSCNAINMDYLLTLSQSSLSPPQDFLPSTCLHLEAVEQLVRNYNPVSINQDCIMPSSCPVVVMVERS
ncbi:hypothetical protein EB796_020598 [Bugula neritina]|uniref:Uncharacterized protein n=1 Tax=Bugula neritina TaxID=10212 RepID=A0A7J7J6C8_BUGNE|nr:hypothetical protein EB796_020598 [Bugula neritina]